MIFIIIALAATLFLYVWKAKKHVEYKNDERWNFIQIKANNKANLLNYLLILLVAVGDTVLIYTDIEITLSLSRVFLYIMLYIGLRNLIELIALKYFDKQM